MWRAGSSAGAAAPGRRRLRGQLPPDPALHGGQALCVRPARRRAAGPGAGAAAFAVAGWMALVLVAVVPVALGSVAPGRLRRGRNRVRGSPSRPGGRDARASGSPLLVPPVAGGDIPPPVPRLHLRAGWGRNRRRYGTTGLDSFPPLDDPRKLPRWLVVIHTGTMFAYPGGGQDGLSTPTFVCFAVAAYVLWRRGRGAVAIRAARTVLRAGAVGGRVAAVSLRRRGPADGVRGTGHLHPGRARRGEPAAGLAWAPRASGLPLPVRFACRSAGSCRWPRTSPILIATSRTTSVASLRGGSGPRRPRRPKWPASAGTSGSWTLGFPNYRAALYLCNQQIYCPQRRVRGGPALGRDLTRQALARRAPPRDPARSTRTSWRGWPGCRRATTSARSRGIDIDLSCAKFGPKVERLAAPRARAEAVRPGPCRRRDPDGPPLSDLPTRRIEPLNCAAGNTRTSMKERSGNAPASTAAPRAGRRGSADSPRGVRAGSVPHCHGSG